MECLRGEMKDQESNLVREEDDAPQIRAAF
jgi:hypothetical protein